ncbi:MAG: PIG-L family deacetylase [Verrucomicrobiales bacterium]|jgi:LmbE family N-acetylglucosaminyl deacetylase|nr:PIG-L family deacetylase [Verrucomicrobiales bacterium]
MKFSRSSTNIFIPDGTALDDACARTTHLGVGAHQDDLEFMALQGIAECFHSEAKWFTGVVCTDGSGSARGKAYAGLTGNEMRKLRRDEQNRAAQLGRFGLMLQLDFPSSAVIGSANDDLKNDLRQILVKTRPRHIYTHNPADKHDTHIAVVMALLLALRELPADWRPETVHGCEVWRDLDWLPDDEKVIYDLSDYEELGNTLNGVFVSQIAAGKRYDLAVAGRRRSNATFANSHATDQCKLAAVAMDLTPLIIKPELDIVSYVTVAIDRFKQDVVSKLNRQLER